MRKFAGLLFKITSDVAIKVSSQQARFYAGAFDNSFAVVYFMYASGVSRHVSHRSFLNKIYHVLVYYDSILVTEKAYADRKEDMYRQMDQENLGNVFVMYVIE